MKPLLSATIALMELWMAVTNIVFGFELQTEMHDDGTGRVFMKYQNPECNSSALINKKLPELVMLMGQ
jgi:hypothetical protein